MVNFNEIMQFGIVVHVSTEGAVSPVGNMFVPECIYLFLDSEGNSPDDEYQDVPDGWSAMSGYTGQHGYNGPTMHPSEFIGGRMARDILDNPGFYVAVMVDGILPDDADDDDTNVGWAVLFYETADSKFGY